jgi:hypothetical protein
MYPLVIQQLDPENNRLLVETNMNQPQWLPGSNYEFTGGEGLFVTFCNEWLGDSYIYRYI